MSTSFGYRDGGLDGILKPIKLYNGPSERFWHFILSVKRVVWLTLLITAFISMNWRSRDIVESHYAGSLHHQNCFVDRWQQLLFILKKNLDKSYFLFTMHMNMGLNIQSHGNNQKIYFLWANKSILLKDF